MSLISTFFAIGNLGTRHSLRMACWGRDIWRNK